MFGHYCYGWYVCSHVQCMHESPGMHGSAVKALLHHCKSLTCHDCFRTLTWLSLVKLGTCAPASLCSPSGVFCLIGPPPRCPRRRLAFLPAGVSTH
jgi:hypothetical protein